MKPIKITLLITILGVTACQKVIDLKLRNNSGKYVIEGNVTNLPGPYQVTIGKTGAVDADYSLQGVSQAAVIISDNSGNTETLQETAPGIYRTKTLQGVEGRTYNLDITVGGTHLTATSVMPHQVNLDSLYLVDVFNFSKTVKAIVPLFTDPPGQGNSYRFNQTINGILDKTLYYQNDDFTDGKTSTWSLLRPDADSTLHSKDNVSVEMQCIDAPMYKYWYSVDMSSTGNGSTIASNPVTNIAGGGLGYFSAHTSQTKTLIVP
jgi:hypothetical protein